MKTLSLRLHKGLLIFFTAFLCLGTAGSSPPLSNVVSTPSLSLPSPLPFTALAAAATPSITDPFLRSETDTALIPWPETSSLLACDFPTIVANPAGGIYVQNDQATYAVSEETLATGICEGELVAPGGQGLFALPNQPLYLVRSITDAQGENKSELHQVESLTKTTRLIGSNNADWWNYLYFPPIAEYAVTHIYELAISPEGTPYVLVGVKDSWWLGWNIPPLLKDHTVLFQIEPNHQAMPVTSLGSRNPEYECVFGSGYIDLHNPYWQWLSHAGKCSPHGGTGYQMRFLDDGNLRFVSNATSYDKTTTGSVFDFVPARESLFKKAGVFAGDSIHSTELKTVDQADFSSASSVILADGTTWYLAAKRAAATIDEFGEQQPGAIEGFVLNILYPNFTLRSVYQGEECKFPQENQRFNPEKHCLTGGKMSLFSNGDLLIQNESQTYRIGMNQIDERPETIDLDNDENNTGGGGTEDGNTGSALEIGAPPLHETESTSFEDRVEFLYTGEDPVQKDVAAGTINPEIIAVITGRVRDSAGNPLSGVRITLNQKAEYGYTETRSDGEFDFATNGGLLETITYEKSGYLPVQRKVTTSWKQFSRADDVYLTRLNAHSEQIAVNANEPQLFSSPIVTDKDGARQAKIFFPAHTNATLTLADGSTQPLSQMTVRVSEFTVGENGFDAMPGPLPSNIAYTWAADFSVDEALAANAKLVQFSQPVVTYVDNFVGFSTGVTVPAAYYDYDLARWVAEDNGRVIEILRIENGKAVIALDQDNNGNPIAATAERLTEYNVTEAELHTLANQYTVGKTLWRVPLAHFSPWDFNWPWGPITPVKEPTDYTTNTDTKPSQPSDCTSTCCAAGCEINPLTGTLGESIALKGLPFSLKYFSPAAKSTANALAIKASGIDPLQIYPNEVSSYEESIQLQEEDGYALLTITGDDVINKQPASIQINLLGSGGVLESLSSSDSMHVFKWNGYSRYGRPWLGTDTAHITYTYNYGCRYYEDQEAWARAWNEFNHAIHSSSGGSGGGSGGNSVGEKAIVISSRCLQPIKVIKTAEVKIASPNPPERIVQRIYHPESGAEATVTTVVDSQPQQNALRSGGWNLDILHGLNLTTGEVQLGSGGSIAAKSHGSERWNCDFWYATVAPQGGIYYTDGTSRIYYASESALRHPDCSPSIPVSHIGGKPIVSPTGQLYVISPYITGSQELYKVIDADTAIRIAGDNYANNWDRTSTVAANSVRLDSISSPVFAPNGDIYAAIEIQGFYTLARIATNGMLEPLSSIHSNDREGSCLVTSSHMKIGDEYPISQCSFGSIYYGMYTGWSNLVQMSFLTNGHLRIVISSPLHNPFGGVFDLLPNGYLKKISGNSSGINPIFITPVTEALFASRFAHIEKNGKIWYLTNKSARWDDGYTLNMMDATATIIESIHKNLYTTCTYFTSYYDPSFHCVTAPPYGGHMHDIQKYPDGSLLVWDDYHFYRTNSPIGASRNITSPDGSEQWKFNSNGKHLETWSTTTGQRIWKFEYDAHGRLERILDALEHPITFTRDVNGNVATITGVNGRGVSLSYNNNQMLSGVTADVGQQAQGSYHIQYESATSGLMARFERPNGRWNSWQWKNNRVVKDRDAAGVVWNISGNTLTSGEGLVYSYDYSGKKDDSIYRRTFPDGSWIETEERNSIITTRASNGREVTQQLAPDSRFKGSVKRPARTETTIDGISLVQTTSENIVLNDGFDPLSLKTWEIKSDFNGLQSKTLYTRATGEIRSTSPAERVSQTWINPLGQTLKTQIPGLAAVEYEYNADAQLVRVHSGTRSNRYDYYAAGPSKGLLKSATDTLGRTVSYAYDASARLAQQTLPNGREIRYQYDPSGLLLHLTMPNGEIHSFDYEARDLPQDYVAPELNAQLTRSRTLYDKDKRVKQVTRADGSSLFWRYNATNGYLDRIETPDGTLHNAYDRDGQLVQSSGLNGNTLRFDYSDTLLKGIAWGGEVNGAVRVSYDNYLRQNQLTVAASGDEFPIALQYDADSLPVQIGDLLLDRDASNGMITGTTLITNHALNTITTNRDFNAYGEIERASAAVNDTEIFSATYTRNVAGMIAGISETANGISAQKSYQFDNLGRLIEADGKSYAYDANGNRIHHGGITATYNAQDQLVSFGNNAYSYTKNGELKEKISPAGTTRYNYDVQGALKKITLPNGDEIEYLTDPSGRRIGKKINGALKFSLIYQSDLRPAAQLNENGNLQSIFIYGDKGNAPSYMVKDGINYRIISDHLGSVRMVINSETGQITQQIEYDVWGKVLSDTNPGFQPFGFAGGIYDHETGLVRFGARDYDAEIGRWTAKDPIGFNGGLNFYDYVNGDPVNFIDPSGLSSFCIGAFRVVGATGVGALGSLGGFVGGGLIGGATCSVVPGLGTVSCGAVGAATGATAGAAWGLSTGDALGSSLANILCSDNGDEADNDSSSDSDNSGEKKYPDNPDDEKDKFTKIPKSKGYFNNEDSSVWERDHSKHGGEQWKRWKNKRDWEKGKKPNSIWPDGRVRK